MRAVDIIARKRDGLKLDEAEIRFLVKGYVSGEIPDYQVSAWLMAVYLQSMDSDETGYLTRAMIDSGTVMDLSTLVGPLVDKHSTGGVGDKLSLILAPMAAACGLQIPMMSGRALGHTGGTLDKLDAIPGFRTSLTENEFRDIIAGCGFAMTGQTREVVPADRLMYALRDVTSTVESIPLITASIMSKKFAEGAQSLVFDVKCGSGAFMKSRDSARALARSLVDTGKSLGRKTVAVLTSMEEPLGRMTGNFLEVEESWEALNGNGPPDIMEVTNRLTAWMLVAGGKVSTPEEGEVLANQAISSGQAAGLFLKNIQLQGGDPDKFLSLCGKRHAPFRKELKAATGGYVGTIDALTAGKAAVHLGVGRNKTTDPVEPHAGIEFIKKHGDSIRTDDTWAILYAADESRLETAAALMESMFVTEPYQTNRVQLILEEMTAL
jgi:pyrimidine-nucleoside phosphorylase